MSRQPASHGPLEQVVIGTRIRRIEPGRKYDHRSPSAIDGPFVRRAVDPDRPARHDDEAVEHGFAREGVREVERLIIGPPGAHDGDRAPKIRKLANDPKLRGRIRKVAQPGGIVRAT